jgi:hypothetical protein
LDELPRAQRPEPFFTTLAQEFNSLEEACAWLGAEAHGQGVRVRGVEANREGA